MQTTPHQPADPFDSPIKRTFTANRVVHFGRVPVKAGADLASWCASSAGCCRDYADRSISPPRVWGCSVPEKAEMLPALATVIVVEVW